MLQFITFLAQLRVLHGQNLFVGSHSLNVICIPQVALKEAKRCTQGWLKRQECERRALLFCGLFFRFSSQVSKAIIDSHLKVKLSHHRFKRQPRSVGAHHTYLLLEKICGPPAFWIGIFT